MVHVQGTFQCEILFEINPSTDMTPIHFKGTLLENSWVDVKYLSVSIINLRQSDHNFKKGCARMCVIVVIVFFKKIG